MGRHAIKRSWPILSFAFGSLMILIALLGVGALRKARQIHGEISSLYEANRRTDHILADIRVGVHVSGIYVRDFLLDPSHIAGAYFRSRLRDIRDSTYRNLDIVETQIGSEESGHFRSLRAELDGYWRSLEPLFEWTPRQKAALSYSFLRSQVMPRRNAVLAMARDIEALNEASLTRREQALRERQRASRRDLAWMLAASLTLGLLVAGASLFRISRLEARAGQERRRVEEAERKLRRLSQQLVQAQEEERKTISRELHDEVGQMLTALRMELGGLERRRVASNGEFDARLDEAKRLTENTLRVVRDLSLGLRPSMLDDLGLGPALEWQAREFSRRSGVPVGVRVEGDLTALPEQHRTCVFRVVQEALTNCARYAQAKEIRINVHGQGASLALTVEDDGAGMPSEAGRGRGLGLIGIEERVRELGGAFEIISRHGHGTVLKVALPLRSEQSL